MEGNTKSKDTPDFPYTQTLLNNIYRPKDESIRKMHALKIFRQPQHKFRELESFARLFLSSSYKLYNLPHTSSVYSVYL